MKKVNCRFGLVHLKLLDVVLVSLIGAAFQPALIALALANPVPEINCSKQNKVSGEAKNAFSAFLSSVGTAYSVYPIELRKTVKQLGLKPDPYSTFPKYVKNNLYKGVSPFVFAQVGTTGIIYPFKDYLKSSDLTGGSVAISAGIATLPSSFFFSNPVNHYRTKQTIAMKDEDRLTPLKFMKNSKEKPSYFFRGSTLSFGYATANGLFFKLFEEFQKFQKEHPGQPGVSDVKLFNDFLASASARAIVTTLFHPIDTVRTTRHAFDLSYEQIIEKFKKEGGVCRYYRGLADGVARNAATSAICLSAYEWMKETFRDEIQE